MTDQPDRRKGCYVGAPAIFTLEIACNEINAAFAGEKSFGMCYLVGSALKRPDWRDVDVRYIMPDAEFMALFPDVDIKACTWGHDARWLLLTVAISERLTKLTGLPVDFQFQPQSHANTRHKGFGRNPLGMRSR